VEVAPDGACGALPSQVARHAPGEEAPRQWLPPQHKCLNMLRMEVSLASFVRLLGCEPHTAHRPRRRAWASASSPGGPGAQGQAGEVLDRGEGGARSAGEQAGGARGVSGCGGELHEQRMERWLKEEGG